MNTAMYENPIVQDNIKKLLSYGYEVLTPASGYLACGDTGAGKMPEPETLLEYILKEVAFEKDLAGKKVLVTAGPTQEAIDPVRCLTNHSSGKMGIRNCKDGYAPGSGGHAGKWTYCHPATTLCKCDSCDNGQRYV